MIAVIFEVWPADGRIDDYFKLVEGLKPDLEQAEGFISVERFESITEPGKLLSFSVWESDEALAKWRQLHKHRRAQAAGRGGVFADYRLRVASVIRDYGMNARDEAPADSVEAHG